MFIKYPRLFSLNGNELSLKLLERVISIASQKGDIVFDPFGGSGTTYIVAEILERKWIGIEIGDISPIKKRFTEIDKHRKFIDEIQKTKNTLFTAETRRLRIKNGHWLPETLKK